MMMAMEAAAYLNNSAKAIERLHELIPDFRPSEIVEDAGIIEYGVGRGRAGVSEIALSGGDQGVAHGGPVDEHRCRKVVAPIHK